MLFMRFGTAGCQIADKAVEGSAWSKGPGALIFVAYRTDNDE